MSFIFTGFLNLTICTFVLCAFSPEREKGEELCPPVPPFSLLLREEDELGLEVDAMLENGRVLQSEKAQRGTTKTVVIRQSISSLQGKGVMHKVF